MGLKQFNLDLRAAISSCFRHVTNVRKGDSDGEIVFTYHPHGRSSIDVQAIATEIDCYPKHSGFMIFTSSDHIADDVDGWFQDIASVTNGKTVVQTIDLVTQTLTYNFNSATNNAIQDEQEEVDEFGDWSFDEEEYQIDIDPLPARRPAAHSAVGHPESMLRLKRHLREVKEEGFHISLPFTKQTSHSFGIFSLSIRVTKLGIPEEALQAWDLKPSDYVVMLTRMPMGYPSMSEFIQLPSDQSAVQFKFGKCARAKPSYHAMRRAFDPDDIGEPASSVSGDDTERDGLFVPLYMSASLDSLLNQEFPSILRIRRSEGLTWDQAQAFKFDLSRGNHHQPDLAAYNSTPQDQQSLVERDWFSLEFLRRDYISETTGDLNTLLVAMQFGLQRLIKCTKYCMVCHQRTDGGFEAVKPFVCDNVLCLYQYLSLGFGQSIEHEIINNPYVVDLLISFFYSAASSHKLRSFPQGLGLKCADTGLPNAPSQHLDVEVCFETRTIKFNSADYASYRSIREGHYVLLAIKGVGITPSIPIMNSSLEKYSCMIESSDGVDYTFRIVATHTTPLHVIPTPENRRQTQAMQPSPGWTKVMLFKHEKDVDGLEAAERDQRLMYMTHTIPPIQEMREYLIGRPARRLSSWKRMDTSTLALLNWIVASNRSFIVQDAPVSASPFTAVEADNAAFDSANLVQGMTMPWLQFRFAQGSPEKEQVFLQELKQLKGPNGAPKQHPSLFAWHGSPLENWHSIIRTGLDFSTTLHGRAFGHGVYLSKDFSTSQGYSARNPATYTFGTWPNSELKVSSAISICEVVNQPTGFVSMRPHLVVNKIEWIQCRYLFVQVDYASQTTDPPPLKHSDRGSQGYIDQDPSHPLSGPAGRPIRIPLSAIPATRRRALGQPACVDILGRVKDNPIVLDDADSDTPEEVDSELDDLLASDDEDGQRQMVRKRRISSTDSVLEDPRPSKLTTAMQNLLKNPDQPNAGMTTSFKPGTLDHESLPKLAEPTWAASSPGALRALGREIKELEKIQSGSDLTSLGWYIDFAKLDNLFHWIVELHSFDESLPLAKDMKSARCSSIVLELRFGSSYPMSPPFVRVIRPRFLPFAQGGGGHVTAGGAICSELLTNSGWSPALSLEKVFLEVRMNLCETDTPARLERSTAPGSSVFTPTHLNKMDYGIWEAVDAFRRAATAHGWQISSDLDMISAMAAKLK
ncbi:hypothetical protein FZEAL_7748 [Fusarium zealandicum]|uniref:UBC core domain-containing protein n=1 Tax=Fusarium zealandicum TaxID=1053134 RepID=A0A8H4UFG5_9HYPO|nr:hypothetical protein FZEAL_7748 [Fusarium zealandicum]